MTSFRSAAAVCVAALLSSSVTHAAEDTTTLLVARQKIAAFTRIDEPAKYFELKTIPTSEAPTLSLQSLKAVKGLRLKRELAEGEPLCPLDLIKAEEFGGVPPGMRAFAIRVADALQTGVVERPGDKVDVLFVANGGKGDAMARVLLQNVEILAVDVPREGKGQGQPAVRGYTVTLAVTPEDAQKLALALTTGELRLVRRPQMEEAKEARAPAVPRSGDMWTVTLKLKDRAVADVVRGGSGTIFVEVPDASGKFGRIVVIPNVRVLDFDSLTSLPDEPQARRTITVSMPVEDAHRLDTGNGTGMVCAADFGGRSSTTFSSVSLVPFGTNANSTFSYVGSTVKGSGGCR
jgi:Flp pilus assembly protein CpaB